MQSVFECTARCVRRRMFVFVRIQTWTHSDTKLLEFQEFCHIQKDSSLYHHRYENLRSRAETFNCLSLICPEKIKAAGTEGTIWAIIFKFQGKNVRMNLVLCFCLAYRPILSFRNVLFYVVYDKNTVVNSMVSYSQNER